MKREILSILDICYHKLKAECQEWLINGLYTFDDADNNTLERRIKDSSILLLLSLLFIVLSFLCRYLDYVFEHNYYRKLLQYLLSSKSLRQVYL